MLIAIHRDERVRSLAERDKEFAKALWPMAEVIAEEPTTQSLTRSEMAELVRAWLAEGASWGECTRRLDERGIPTP
jgi:hypothetical protein